MNPIIVIFWLCMSFLGVKPKTKPVRLAKKESFKVRLNRWVELNFGWIAIVCLVCALIVFVGIVFLVVGACLESNNYYYHIYDTIK